MGGRNLLDFSAEDRTRLLQCRDEIDSVVLWVVELDLTSEWGTGSDFFSV